KASPHWGVTVEYSAYRAPVYCVPVYTHTVELARECFYQCETDYCGRTYRYPVVVVTYADCYSDGSRKVYTRSARS
ncbi:MAG: hypothetical protein EBS01_08760, partial [Verrucomicrobia bacterium]|nr:hypothetical protein [Verrucomicrobiota bacterium]